MFQSHGTERCALLAMRFDALIRSALSTGELPPLHSGGATMGEWENAKVAVPDGAYPLFLTLTTQTNFHCREREECTVERPYVFVSKKTFLDDIQFRGVISDFHPTKKLIEAYPDGVDEQEDGTSGLLVVWDEEEDYGQNFYLVHKHHGGLRCAGTILRTRWGGGAGGREVGTMDGEERNSKQTRCLLAVGAHPEGEEEVGPRGRART
eukprot:scaffold104367_cov28-Tisochrysis_lutea.AAC.2